MVVSWNWIYVCMYVFIYCSLKTYKKGEAFPSKVWREREGLTMRAEIVLLSPGLKRGVEAHY